MRKFLAKVSTALMLGAAVVGGVPNCPIKSLQPSKVQATTRVFKSVQMCYGSFDQSPSQIFHGETINGVFYSGYLNRQVYGYSEQDGQWHVFYTGYLYSDN